MPGMSSASGSAGPTARRCLVPGDGARTALPILARVFERLPPAPRESACRSRRRAVAAAEATDALRLTFPPPGAVLAEPAGP